MCIRDSFYRSLEGMDESGLDVVYQIWPERFEGRMESPFGYLDLTFYYWGLAKMASSFGHLDPKKEGKTMCEIFGAYGWQEGLKLMKWLTDHVCVRGVNRLVPHAFSPKENDEDCPPHFYAGGKNPQWKYFHIWSEYAGRVCSLLSEDVYKRQLVREYKVKITIFHFFYFLNQPTNRFYHIFLLEYGEHKSEKNADRKGNTQNSSKSHLEASVSRVGDQIQENKVGNITFIIIAQHFTVGTV